MCQGVETKGIESRTLRTAELIKRMPRYQGQKCRIESGRFKKTGPCYVVVMMNEREFLQTATSARK